MRATAHDTASEDSVPRHPEPARQHDEADRRRREGRGAFWQLVDAAVQPSFRRCADFYPISDVFKEIDYAVLRVNRVIM